MKEQRLRIPLKALTTVRVTCHGTTSDNQRCEGVYELPLAHLAARQCKCPDCGADLVVEERLPGKNVPTPFSAFRPLEEALRRFQGLSGRAEVEFILPVEDDEKANVPSSAKSGESKKK